ncbi:MAG: hypothetical protein ACRDG4_03875 [Chloroflexota bacterium]
MRDTVWYGAGAPDEAAGPASEDGRFLRGALFVALGVLPANGMPFPVSGKACNKGEDR